MAEKDGVWIVSEEPPSTEYRSGAGASGALVFKDNVSPRHLGAMISEFTLAVGSALQAVGKVADHFCVDQVEVTAVMAVDGKLGILGSSVGGKAEGALKFVFRRQAGESH